MARSTRPHRSAVTSAAALHRWYWSKAELVEWARDVGIPASGRKPELQKRLGVWIDTGRVEHVARRTVTSDFDWTRAKLDAQTVITDNYRNTRNVRLFMQSHLGSRFRFTNEFMEWMRAHVGSRLADAVAFWRELDRKKREEGYREASLPQNQYAQFSRALAEASPGISAAEIRRIWKIKRSGPGPHCYRSGDEDL